MIARLFEKGLYSNMEICREFGYGAKASLSLGKIKYNDILYTNHCLVYAEYI
jgi:hypothetical protein